MSQSSQIDHLKGTEAKLLLSHGKPRGDDFGSDLRVLQKLLSHNWETPHFRPSLSRIDLQLSHVSLRVLRHQHDESITQVKRSENFHHRGDQLFFKLG